MNKTLIEWAHYTWNPVTGCRTGCAYCYARRIATRFAGTKAFPRGFEPTFHPERLKQPARVRLPSRIFVGSMCDHGGRWNERRWLERIIGASAEAPQHRYILLTKHPKGLCAYRFPHWWWVGVSATNDEEATIRAIDLFKVKAEHRFVCIEPLLGWEAAFPPFGSKWIIVGAQTGPGTEKAKPKSKWVRHILQLGAVFGIPVFLKDNLGRKIRWQEYPNDLLVRKRRGKS